MAVSAAMLRPPGGGLDPPFYGTQMMNYSPTEDAKSKKSWGQRLKLGQNPNNGQGTLRISSGSNPYGTVSGPGGSALSKSMKYAETWLYGTVRAPSSPARPTLYFQYAEPPSPVLISTPQPSVQNYAVMVCSCPEYLNGTKKTSSKKVSICKKCKGSRLPLGVPPNGTIRNQVVGGTVRGPPTIVNSNGTVRAGTVKIQPTSKSRPTILSLSPQSQASDPYDLMRRTRLSAPLESSHVGSQFSVARSRAKSISPVRNRTRRRSPSTDSSKRSKSVSRSKDLWYEDIQTYENEVTSRKSILECDVNPYDLMKKTKGDKLKSPEIEDDDEVFADFDNDETFNLKKLQENLSNKSKKGAKHNGPYSSVQAINGQRIRIFGEAKTPSVEEDFVYDDVEVNDERDSRTTRVEVPNRVNVSFGKEQKVDRSERVRIASPKRPPRKNKPETSEEESESDRKEIKQKVVTKQSVNNANRSTVSDPAIKSILKKPPVQRPEEQQQQQDKTLSGSHFYLPTPTPSTVRSSTPQSVQVQLQRKKVQFLVENEVVSSVLVETQPFVEVSETGVEDNDLTSNEKSGDDQLFEDIGNCDLVIVSDDAENAKDSNAENDDGRSMPEGNGEGRAVGRESDDLESGEGWTMSKERESKEGNDAVQNNESPVELLSDNDSFALARGVVLRRSQSERLTVEGTLELPSFMDTMALRQRPSRAHSRQVFISTQSLVEIVNIDRPVRPKDRPPPPPSPLSGRERVPPVTSSVTIVCSNSTKEGDTKISRSIVPIAKNSDYEGYKVSSPKKQEIRFGDHLPSPPPRSRSRERKFPGRKEPNYVKTRFVKDRRLTEEISTVVIDPDERTTVKVSAENSYESRTVHRLSINQNSSDSNDEESSSNDENNSKKTSIMISGDDCYSTMNVNNDTPLYQSSVTVNGLNSVQSSGNTVTISVFSESEDSDVSSKHSNQIYIHNDSSYDLKSPVKTLVVVDYEGIDEKSEKDVEITHAEVCVLEEKTSRGTRCHENVSNINSASEEISILLRDPVEAVKRNLVPHVCGKAINESTNESIDNPITNETELKALTRSTFVSKLLEDPMLGHLAEGLDTDLVARLIENSLLRLKESRKDDYQDTNENDEAMSRLIDASLLKLQEERSTMTRADEKLDMLLNESEKSIDRKINVYDSPTPSKRNSVCSQNNNVSNGNNNCSPSYESMEYESGLMGASSDQEPLSDCYNASASELSTEEENLTRSKFYQMLVDATLSEIEISHTMDDDHHYESIRLNQDPIYEEIGDMPPPLPLSPPPLLTDDDKKSATRSIFEGASKYDILSYLVDAKERGIVPEDNCSLEFNGSNDLVNEDDVENGKERIDHQRQSSDLSSRVSNLSNGSDSSEDNSLIISNLDGEKTTLSKKSSTEIERNDSGVGSETSKCSRSRWQSHNIPPNSILDNVMPIHLCEDCDGPVETQITESGVMYAPLVCRKCGKKRAERKEIITEIVETEEKYGRDLQIILEEFYQPMLVAGLLTQEQLSAIFLNVEELLENNQNLAERLRDALEIAIEQGDEDLLTVNIGKLMLESASMLHAFTSYCVRQGAASMLLSGLEKEKELLRIFLKVSQMENTVLRRMNLNSFLMVPVQRVTKYPLLLSRLFKVTPSHLEGREQLKQAQQKIEQHLSHMNSEAKDMTTLKLWRRISSNNNGRRSSSEMDMINIKLRKLAVDVLEWNHEEARFAMEGKLLFTQPNDNNWRKGRTIKLTPINALLVTNGKPTAAYKPCEDRSPYFPRNTGIREASLVLARDKAGRAALLREPLYLDRCVVAAENDWDDYFELQEIVTKDTYIFKAEDSARTRQWCQQLQYHCQGMGAWRKRRNALANIMINGMMTRN